MEQWMCPKVPEWVETIETLRKFAVRYLQTAYDVLTMLLQAKWQYLMRTVPGVQEYMVPVE